MNINKIQNIINFARLIPNNHDIAYKYNNLVRLSKRLTTIDTHTCNGTKYITDEEYTKATENVYKHIKAYLQVTKLHFYHQSDPRGVALYVSKEPLTQSNYSSKGLAIY